MATETSGDWATASGDRWLGSLDAFEAMLAPLGEALLARAAIPAGANVIDVGCGGGWTSRRLARIVGDTGSVLGLDVAPQLVAEATRRAAAEGLDKLAFVVGDAGALALNGRRFERMVSRLGIMFFPRPAEAFAHLATLLAPGGRADFAVWAAAADNGWMSGARAIAERRLPIEPADPRAPGPFSLADPDAFAKLLVDSGFADVTADPWEAPMPIGGPGRDAAATADFAMRAFAFSDAVDALSAGTVAALRAELTAFYAAHETPQGVRVPARAWLVSAKRA